MPPDTSCGSRAVVTHSPSGEAQPRLSFWRYLSRQEFNTANWLWQSPFAYPFLPALLKVTQAGAASLLLHLLFGLTLTEPNTGVEKCQVWYCWTLLSVIQKPAEPTRGQIVLLHMGLFCFRQVSNLFGHVSVTWKEQRAEQPGARWAWPPPPAPALPIPTVGIWRKVSLQVPRGETPALPRPLLADALPAREPGCR